MQIRGIKRVIESVFNGNRIAIAASILTGTALVIIEVTIHPIVIRVLINLVYRTCAFTFYLAEF